MPVTDDETLREIVKLDPIAVVGCSTTAGKPAHDVPKLMHDNGYTIVPVNPYADEVFGLEAYDSLEEVEEEIPLVDVFRPSEETGPIVDAAAARDDVEAIWLQLGITNDEAGARAEAAGKRFVQDRCLKVEYQRLL